MSQDLEFTPLDDEEPPDFPGPGEDPPPPTEPPRGGGAGPSPLWIGALILLLICLSGAAWWFLMGRAPSGEDERRAAALAMAKPQPPAAAAPEQAAGEEEPPALDLPPLETSDGPLRGWIGELSQHPKLAEYLVSDDLARRLVATVDNIARGESPSPHLTMLRPRGPFEVLGGDSRAIAAEASHRRYDLAVEVFSSLDIAATARLFHGLEPLLEEAYQDLGDPSRDFRTTLALAIDHLLAVEIPTQPPLLERTVVTYRYADPGLESASPARKHLLRLGPDNARKVQNKLRFLRAALDLPAGDREPSAG
ncbi:MAG: DUF3014 domain-containing protein [Acidobacteriota bacterium]